MGAELPEDPGSSGATVLVNVNMGSFGKTDAAHLTKHSLVGLYKLYKESPKSQR